MTVSNVEENQGKLGRLKLVRKVRKPFICRECKKDFPVGSSCYNQSDYTRDGFFPVQTKICLDCGQVQINNGIEVKECLKSKVKKSKDIKPKKKQEQTDFSPGCGVDTEYPKSDRSKMWKCGEDTMTMIGCLFCNKCLNNFTLNPGIQNEI